MDEKTRRALEDDYANGSQAAFTKLWREVEERLARYLAGRGVRDHANLADGLQEVARRAWELRERFDPLRASFAAWTFGIARNVALQHLSRATMRALREVELGDIPLRAPTPEQLVISDESAAVIDNVIRRHAPESLREVIHNILLGGTRAEEARRLGVKPNTMTVRIRRLGERIRHEIEDQLGLWPESVRAFRVDCSVSCKHDDGILRAWCESVGLKGLRALTIEPLARGTAVLTRLRPSLFCNFHEIPGTVVHSFFGCRPGMDVRFADPRSALELIRDLERSGYSRISL